MTRRIHLLQDYFRVSLVFNKLTLKFLYVPASFVRFLRYPGEGIFMAEIEVNCPEDSVPLLLN